MHKPVGVGRVLVECVCEASHGQLFLLVDLRNDPLLMHCLELAFFGLGFLLQSLDGFLEYQIVHVIALIPT